MRISSLASVVALSAALLTPAISWAEEEKEAPPADGETQAANRPVEGMSLSFGIPSGGNGHASGAAGVWMLVTPDINLGINVGLALDSDNDPVLFDILLGPAIRYYLGSVGPVTPFIAGQLNFRIVTSPETDVEIALAGGFGAEWFVTEQFSIAGHVGLGFDILRQGRDPLGLGTFTSGLTAQIYLNP